MKSLSGIIEYKGIEFDYTAELQDEGEANPDRITELDPAIGLSAAEEAIWENEWEDIEAMALDDALKHYRPAQEETPN